MRSWPLVLGLGWLLFLAPPAEAQFTPVGSTPHHSTGGGGAAPTVAQEVDSGFIAAGCQNPATTGCTQTITATTSGQIIVVGYVNFNNSVVDVPVVKTNNNDTCTARADSGNYGTGFPSDNIFVAWWVCPSVTVGSTSVSFTAGGSLPNSIGISVFVLNGAKTVGTPYEGSTGTSITADTVSCPITTSSTADLLFLIVEGRGRHAIDTLGLVFGDHNLSVDPSQHDRDDLSGDGCGSGRDLNGLRGDRYIAFMRWLCLCLAAAFLLAPHQAHARFPTFGGATSTSPPTPRALTGGNPGPSLALYNAPPYQCLTNDYINAGGGFTDANGNVWGAGSDSNPGSSFASPWQTLDHAEAAVTTAGSCIIVAPGVYGRTSQLAISHGGNAATPTGYIVWRCSVMPFSFAPGGALQGEGSGCVIRATAPFPIHPPPDNNINSMVVVGAPYVWLDALEYDGNANNVPFACASTDGSGNNDHLWLTNSDARGCGWDGLDVGQSEYQYELHNVVHGNSSEASYPSYCCGSGIHPYGPQTITGYSPTAMDNEWCETTNCYSVVIAYNVIYGQAAPPERQVDSNGLQLDGFDNFGGTCVTGHTCPYTGHALVMGNIAFGNAGRGLMVNSRGSSGYISVVNNTTYDDVRNVSNGSPGGEI